MRLTHDDSETWSTKAGDCRCRVQVFLPDTDQRRPVVVFTELADNPGVPVAAVVHELAAAVSRRLSLNIADVVWIESWWGRALAAFVRDLPNVKTLMQVDLSTRPARREPLTPKAFGLLTGSSSP